MMESSEVVVPRPNVSEKRNDQLPEGALVWRVEPIKEALAESGAKRQRPEDYVDYEACIEVGRRLLLAQFTFSSWVLRRVEKVKFASDRRIARSSSIEFRIPEEAPVVHVAGEEPRWLIPLSVMRRHTLVNLDLRTEEGQGISLLGLRFTQRLDEAMLKAAARLACPEKTYHTEIDDFIHEVVSGKWRDVQSRLEYYKKWRAARSGPAGEPEPLYAYFEDATFRASLERMWHNFTLYVTLPVSAGRHRVLRLAFEEQLRWKYQLPRLRRDEQAPDRTETWEYKPLAKWLPGWRPGHYFGWRPTRIRFLTPSAENCASYHFEFTAPTGLWVTSAAFVGGRPNVAAAGVTPWDSVTRTGHSAGLHAVEVPNGSLCRAQVNLRVPARGWLSTLLVSCAAVVVVLGAVAWHAPLFATSGQWTAAQVTNIVLLLVTVCAGASTYVAQHSSGDVAARMLSGLRLVGVVVLSLPAVAAVSLVFLRDQSSVTASSGPGTNDRRRIPGWLPETWVSFMHDTPTRDLLWWFLMGLTVIGALITGVVLLACLRSWADERHSGRDSPWDMTTVDEEQKWGWQRKLQQRKQPIEGDAMSFRQLTEELRLTKPAVGVYSAEGWHERYGWTDSAQDRAVKRLRGEVHKIAYQPLCACDAVADHDPRPQNATKDPRTARLTKWLGPIFERCRQ